MKSNWGFVLPVALFICFTPYRSPALNIQTGDIIIRSLGKDFGTHLLRRTDNYSAEIVSTSVVWPNFDIDRARQRIYAQPWEETPQYLDLGSEPNEFRDADFVPQGMWLSSAAGDGSYLILKAETPHDIFAEENLLLEKPTSPSAGRGVMLYRYDMETGAITRLTYSYSQPESWVSDDGRVMAYIRFSNRYVPTNGSYEGYDENIIFCRTDGRAKYSLRGYLAEAGFNLLDDPDAEMDFAPKRMLTSEGDAKYCTVFRPNDSDRTPVEGEIEYYTAYMQYEGERLKCEVEKKDIELPEGIALKYFYSAQSDYKEIYFMACETDEPEEFFLMRYDVEPRKFVRIPNSEGSSLLFVY
jgi:hypothetical protein